ncbi:cytochrome c3 family protein [Urbifossiella limnaea]|uniref:Cytochrome c7-like domain-containing protein n=1 Tax=Urbifossiella limnaea TaxID=2528023 RepID=A0A517XR12_9BACT|nr:cytochrome c3 family protein [Urbifossiella limnaea]QDU19945.1 hypothetical protein ETAA1_18850 [Urbifossiella limnaea]
MPRSPSRDRSDRFTGFRGYVRVPDAYARAKSVALLSAGVLLGLWLVVEAAHPRAGAFHTHGELANPHAAWDQDCAACHRSQGIGDFSLSNVLNARDRWHDLTCTKCHAGPPHHATVADTAFHDRCSNCHHDHAGRTTSLTDISDEHCVRCHQNLPAAHVAGQSGYEAVVTAFAGNHPEFRVLRDYPPGQNYTPRKLKFSHAVHMTPGLTNRMTTERVAQLGGPDAAKRYEGYNTAEGIALNCAACHQLDAQAPDHPGVPRAEGAYYLPIKFENHCQSCHPLAAPPGKAGTAVVDGFPVPHQSEGGSLAALLRGGYAANLLRASPAAAKAPLPGGRLDPAPAPKELTEFGAAVDSLTSTAQNQLHGGGATCGKCHYPTPGGASLPGVSKLPQHTVWFQHAKFNHVSHRGLTCAECHPGTGRPAAPIGSVNEVEPIAIRGVKSCQACHAPAGTPVVQDDGTTTFAAGVRHRCTDCHRYHNGDRPLHGLGSPRRDPQTPQTLADFLKGGK